MDECVVKDRLSNTPSVLFFSSPLPHPLFLQYSEQCAFFFPKQQGVIGLDLQGVKDPRGNCKEVISFTSPPLMAARLTEFSRGLNRPLRGKCHNKGRENFPYGWGVFTRARVFQSDSHSL